MGRICGPMLECKPVNKEKASLGLTGYNSLSVFVGLFTHDVPDI